MPRRWLGMLGLVGVLACAGLEDNDSAPRCSATEPCPDALICYRNFCIDELAGEPVDGGGPARTADASARDAGSVGADAGTSVADAATASVPPEAGAPSPAPTAPVPPAAMPMPAPARGAKAERWRWPWSLEQIASVPPYLVGCLGSCTIVGKKECESCVAEKERQRGEESEYFCQRSDDDGGCGARR